jgi:hypothetical protein
MWKEPKYIQILTEKLSPEVRKQLRDIVQAERRSYAATCVLLIEGGLRERHK